MLKMYFPPAQKKYVPTTGILNGASSLCLVQDCLVIRKTPLHFGKNSLKCVLNVKNWEVKITFTRKRNRQEKKSTFCQLHLVVSQASDDIFNLLWKKYFWLFFYNILLRIIRKVSQITVHFFFPLTWYLTSFITSLQWPEHASHWLTNVVTKFAEPPT